MKRTISLLLKSFCALAILGFALVTLIPKKASAVVLDDKNRISIVLKDGITVVLYGEATSKSDQKINKYHLEKQLWTFQLPEYQKVKAICCRWLMLIISHATPLTNKDSLLRYLKI